MLGPVLVEHAGTPIELPVGQTRALLAVLLSAANEAVPADDLEQALWGEDRPPSARAALRNHMMRLRRLLGPEVGARIQTAPAGYLIKTRAGELDEHDFTDLCIRGQRALLDGDALAASQLLHAALALWRGDPATDLPDLPACATWASRLAETRLTALRSRIDADLRLGRHTEVVAELRVLTAEHPLVEAFHGQLMLALYRSGRPAEALAAFRALRRGLVRELGVEPSSLIQDLHQQILSADTRLALTAATPDQTPAAPTTLPVAQLPADIRDFTGRAELVERLCGLLSGSGPLPVVAVTGVGGIGKTSLALHAAHRLARRFPDGQLYVNLGGSGATPRDPVEVLGDTLRALGIADRDIPNDQDAREAQFRSATAGSRLLIVLDDARNAAHVRPLIPGGAGCAVLVTSRRLLPGLAGAEAVAVDVLETAEAEQLFGAIVGASRAHAEPEARQQVLASCGGLPLAIRIAAARLAARPAWTVADLAARLADEHSRLDELSTEDVAVRACFQMSYAQLADPAVPAAAHRARAFRLLGLWPAADLPTAAAAELLGLSSAATENALEALVDVHLLENPAAGRYRLHDLLRVYARELADAQDPPEDRDQAVERLITWYTRTASAACDQFAAGRVRYGLDTVPACASVPGFADREAALAWCLRERANLVATVALAGGRPSDPAAWVLPAQMLHFYLQVGHWWDLLATHTVGLETARALGDPVARSRMLSGLAWALDRLQLPDAMERVREAAEAAEESGDERLAAAAMSNYAAALDAADRHEEAVAWHEKALPVIRAAGKPEVLAAALHNLGISYGRLERHHDAIAQFQTALELARQGDAPFVEGNSLNAMGIAHRELGDTAQAIALFGEAVAIRERIGDEAGQATSLDCLGDALAAEGRSQEARAAWQRALAFLEGQAHPFASQLRAKMDRLTASGA